MKTPAKTVRRSLVIEGQKDPPRAAAGQWWVGRAGGAAVGRARSRGAFKP